MGVFDPEKHENLLGIASLEQLNELEALGIIKTQEYIFDIDVDFVFDSRLILDIHYKVFGDLYEWAGKWRDIVNNIGIPPQKIPYAIIEYAEQVNYLKSHITSQKELVDCLAYAHHRYTQIHPFNNGNGRTARLLTNLIANINGYQNVQLYVTESGNEREKYRAALRSADAFDYAPLKSIINQRLLRF